jgi:hypothetical protein
LSKAKFKIRGGMYQLYVPLLGPEPVHGFMPQESARRGETPRTIEDVERTMKNLYLHG